MSDIFIDIRGLIGTSKPRFHDPFDEGRRRTGGKGRGGFVSRLPSYDRRRGNRRSHSVFSSSYRMIHESSRDEKRGKG